MKYAVLFGTLAALFLLAAFIHSFLAIPLIWAAISFSIIAVGYAGAGPSVTGKKSDGSFRVMYIAPLLPYLLYTWLVWHLYRILKREDAYNRVTDEIIVGRRLLANEIPEDIDCYVDLTAEFVDPAIIRRTNAYLCFPILDASTPDSDKLSKAINLAANGKVYIHCAQGHGRTGLFAVALLVRRGLAGDLDEALRELRKARPGIDLNNEQREFIEQYLSGKS